MKDAALAYIMTLGVVAFVGGVIVGSILTRPAAPAPVSANQDWAKIVCTDALKECQTAQERCWKSALDIDGRRVTCEFNLRIKGGKP